jgi:hypothetical protein
MIPGFLKNRLADFVEGADYSSFDKIINRETGAGLYPVQICTPMVFP